VHDTATVTVTSPIKPTGTVTYYFFANINCNGQGEDDTKPVIPPTPYDGTDFNPGGTPAGTYTVTLKADGTVPDSIPTGALKVGSYSFMAVYSGDSNYRGSTSACEPLTVTAIPTSTNTVIKNGSGNPVTSVPLGTSVHDTATVDFTNGGLLPFPVAGFDITKIGTVTYVFTGSELATLTVPASWTVVNSTTWSETVNVNPDGTVPDSDATGPLPVGTDYVFQAKYNGSTDNPQTYTPSQPSPLEPLTVNPVTPLLPTEIENDFTDADLPVDGNGVATIDQGLKVHDSARLTNVADGFGPTGTVTYTFYKADANFNPVGAAVYSSQVTLTTTPPNPADPDNDTGTLPATGVYTPESASSPGVLLQGNYVYKVTFTSADGNYLSVGDKFNNGTHDTVEKLTVLHRDIRMTGGGSIFLPSTSNPAGPAVYPAAGTRVTHGFELHCAQPTTQVNNHLEINWFNAKGAQNHFHLDNPAINGGGDGLLNVICLNDGRIDPAPPPFTAGGPDTMIGYGVGLFTGTVGTTRYNKATAHILFFFDDAGEPGVNDRAAYYIKIDSTGTVVLNTGDFSTADITAGLAGNLAPLAGDLYSIDLTAQKLTKGNHQVHLELPNLLNATLLSSGPAAVESQLVATFGDLAANNLNQGKVDNLIQDLLDEALQFESALGGATISGTVFHDANQNGIWDLGEGGFAGIQVSLYTSTGVLVATTTTDITGAYSFNAAPGTYKVVFNAPGYQFSTGTGNDPAVSSDVNTAGITALFSLSAGQIDDMLNAGIY
jgi:hypothetical protein